MTYKPWMLIFLSLALVLSSLAAQPVSVTPWQDKVDPWVLETAADGETEFLVFLAEQADLSPAAALPTKLAKGQFVYRTLTETAVRTQGPLLAELTARGIPHRPYWVANMVWVRADLATIQALAGRSDVAHLYANPQVRMDTPFPVTNDQERGMDEPGARGGEPEILEPMAIEWNITKVNAPAVWAAGFTGQGAVIAGQDTGYQWDHPALKGKYRGWNGTTANHDYNWHDAIHTTGSSCGANSPVPCDDNGHGTHTMGTMVGDDGAANQIGMAPGARWIGCRNMNTGVGTPTTYSECYQWFIAPTRVNGTDPDPSKAPDVINNSWGCPPSEGCTDPNVLLSVVQAVRMAGIVTVHSAGNDGPNCSTVQDPAAIYAESFSVGATTNIDAIDSYSSRGPVTVDGSNRLKPNISAPGSRIRSSVRNSGYSTMSGTSMAGPHVAGLVALLISAEPSAAGQVDYLENVIEESAVRLTSSQVCGGVPGSAIPNNTFGWGRIDALAAYNALHDPFILTTPEAVMACAPAAATIAVNVSPWTPGFHDPVTLGASGHPLGTTASFNPNPVTPPGSSTLTIGNTAAAAPGAYTVTITGVSGAWNSQEQVALHIANAAPAAPAVIAPVDGSINQPVGAALAWGAVPQAASYEVQVATDPAFTTVVASATGLTGTSFTPAAALAANTVHYWRVAATNGCGGVWSSIAAFHTATSTPADFSDLPNSYGVAWHTGGGSLKLGAAWTADSSFADGNDNPSDDGVTPALNAWWAGGRGAVDVTVSGGNGCLDGWMDFGNGTAVGPTQADGDFDDTFSGVSEHVIAARPVAAGAANITFDVPPGLLGQGANNTYAFRFRLVGRKAGQACGAISAFGALSSGEVEDYRFIFNPQAVTLAGFTVEATTDGVTLAWETVSELNNAGFNVYRAQDLTGFGETCQVCQWVQLNDTLIPAAAPGSGQGAAYTFTDTTAAPGATYWYALEDVALDGTTTRHEPAAVTVAEPNTVGLAGFGVSAADPSLAGLAALALAAFAGVGLRRRRRS